MQNKSAAQTIGRAGVASCRRPGRGRAGRTPRRSGGGGAAPRPAAGYLVARRAAGRAPTD